MGESMTDDKSLMDELDEFRNALTPEEFNKMYLHGERISDHQRRVLESDERMVIASKRRHIPTPWDIKPS